MRGLLALLTAITLGIGRVYGELPVSGFWGAEMLGRYENSTGTVKCVTMPFPEPTAGYMAVVAVHNLHGEPGKRYGAVKASDRSPEQGICLTSLNGDTLSVTLAVERVESPLDYQDRLSLHVRITEEGTTVRDEIVPLTGKKFTNFTDEQILRVSAVGGEYKVEISMPEFITVWTGKAGAFIIDNAGIILSPGSAVEVRDFSMLAYAEGKRDVAVAHLDSLRQQILFSQDILEGEWVYYDRSLDESVLRSGGRYRLLAVKGKDGGYDLYYISGAEKNPDFWKPGMLKARMTPQSGGRYSVEWRDAEGLWMKKGLVGALEDASTLSIVFPYQQGSNMRFIRE